MSSYAIQSAADDVPLSNVPALARGNLANADLVTFTDDIQHPLDAALPFSYNGCIHILSACRAILKNTDEVQFL